VSVYELLEDPGHDSAKWHEVRTASLGASEVAAVLGLSEWQTPLSVYMTKMGVRNQIPENLSYFGHKLEPVIAQWIRDKHPEVGEVSDGFSARSVEFPWLTSTPDRLTFDPVTGGPVPIELKTSSAFSREKWADGVPLVYQVQVQTQMLVIGAAYAWLAVLHGGNEPELFRVDRDNQFIDEHLIPKTRAFWFDHVVAQVPPEPTTLGEVAEVYPSESRAIVGSELVIEAAEQRAVILSDMAALKEQADAFTLAIAQYMGTADTLTRPDGSPVLTYKTQAGRRSVSVAALEKAHPDIAAQLVQEGEPFKVMRMAKEKK
jgi:putative phage-type endonuclease